MIDLEGIEDIQEFTEEEKLALGKTFADSAGSPLSLAWEKIFKAALHGRYYQLAHMMDYDVAKTALIAGMIRETEIHLGLPKVYAEYYEESHGTE